MAAGVLLLPLLLSALGSSCGCLQDPAEAYRLTGAVCRLTAPAAAVLNEQTTAVMEAAFQQAQYPSVTGRRSLGLMGTLQYGLQHLQVRNLSIGRSVFQLLPGEGISLDIGNVSAVFSGTLQYGYGSWLVNVGHSVDFEIESQIDLGINPRLYCGGGRVAADTSDCYLNFHKLHLHLQGDKEPNWLKKLFTDFITFTVKLVVKGQICKEINKVANILADFIQDTAEHFLSDGDISVDIGVTAAPVITENYIESYHKGVTNYQRTSAVISRSVFHPSQLTEDRMLYFWISDQVLNPMMAAAHHDGRFQLNVTGEDFLTLFRTNFSSVIPDFISECLTGSASPELRVWSSSVPVLNTSRWGTGVRAQASGWIRCGSPDRPPLCFQTDVLLDVTASYAHKRLLLHGGAAQVRMLQAQAPPHTAPLSPAHLHNQSPQAAYVSPGQQAVLLDFLREAVETVGVPRVLAVLQTELTRLLDQQGANLFHILDPQVLPQEGSLLIQMDFGFPHHLLVDFLKKTLQ